MSVGHAAPWMGARVRRGAGTQRWGRGWGLRLIAVLVAAFGGGFLLAAGSAEATVTTATNAASYLYDGPTVARVGGVALRAVDTAVALRGASQEGSVSPIGQLRGTSTTPSRALVATEAAPPRFVAASDGIIDTEAPALQQQIGDVADSIQTTGSPPPGVRQGGLPGKPGVYGNKSGALPTQPEGYYTESDVWPGPGSRGTERIVVGANGEVWYSPDHYVNFRVVRT